MSHIVHLMLDGIWKADLVEYKDGDLVMREGKKICLQYINQYNQVADAARLKISSQKNPPMEGTAQWDTLYKKYFEEEMSKKGG